MTRDDIIRLAREADSGFEGGPDADGTLVDSLVGLDAIERFAALVAAEKDREILALKEERRKDMAEIYSLRESEESLREKNQQFAALVGEYAAEQAPDALRKVVADRDALQAENEKLRKALQAETARCAQVNEDAAKRYRAAWWDSRATALRNAAKQVLSHDETAIWSARNDPRE